MTAIDRTAYPRPGEKLTREELDNRYCISETDHAFIRATARSDAGRLTLATLLKARQDLGCFPAPLEVHIDTVAHLASQLALAGVPPVLSETTRKTTLHHYRAAVRVYLKASIYADAGLPRANTRPARTGPPRRSGCRYPPEGTGRTWLGTPSLPLPFAYRPREHSVSQLNAPASRSRYDISAQRDRGRDPRFSCGCRIPPGPGTPHCGVGRVRSVGSAIHRHRVVSAGGSPGASVSF
jgi:Domain of unknown function (DUF4158)